MLHNVSIHSIPSLAGLFLDMFSLALAWGTAFYLRYLWDPTTTPPFYPKYFYALVIILFATGLTFKSMGQSFKQTEIMSLPKEIWSILYLFSISYGFILAFSFFYRSCRSWFRQSGFRRSSQQGYRL